MQNTQSIWISIWNYSIVLDIDIALRKQMITLTGSDSSRFKTKSLRRPAKFLRFFIIWWASQVSHCSTLWLCLLVSTTWPSVGALPVPPIPSLGMGCSSSLACFPTNHSPLSELTHSHLSQISLPRRSLADMPTKVSMCSPGTLSSLYNVLTTICFNIFVGNLIG